MYYGNTQLVPIPKSSEKRKIVKANTGYVFIQLGYTWDPVKRQPRYDRKTIGKCDPNHPGMMYYSKEYENYFGPVDEEVARLKEKYGKRELKKAGKLNFCISYGPFAAVESACDKAGCLGPLKANIC